MSDTVIITAIVSGTMLCVIGHIAFFVNIEEIARAFRHTMDWWKERKKESDE